MTEWNKQYPVRCKIVDVTGKHMGNIPLATPAESMQFIGQTGWARQRPFEGDAAFGIDNIVEITLDSGFIIYGHECWWEPIV